MTYHQEGKSRKPVERRESSRLQSAAKLLRSNKNIEMVILIMIMKMMIIMMIEIIFSSAICRETAKK